MTKVLILGSGGMLGHKLLQHLSREFETTGTFRGPVNHPPTALQGLSLEGNIDAQNLDSIESVLKRLQPDVVINCIGLVKQQATASDPESAISINALFPHQLARLTTKRQIRLIHFSTDCIFSGNNGPYGQTDISDAGDLYGRTKYLGEVAKERCLTIRSSIIGPQLSARTSLLEWVLSNAGGRVNGFTDALFTGLPTIVMARLMADVILPNAALDGVWQVAAAPISKFDLLQLINSIYQLNIQIDPDDNFHCDRRLDGSHFAAHTGFIAPPWEQMIADMHADTSPS